MSAPETNTCADCGAQFPAPPTSSVTTRAHQLYRETLALEDVFSAALHDAYGDRAGDMRYQARTWPPSVKTAWQHWAQAMSALQLHWAWSRALTTHEQDAAIARHRAEVARILAS